MELVAIEITVTSDDLTQDVEKAVKETLEYAKDIVQQKTPVRSGVMRSLWATNSSSLFNSDPPTVFVEYGTRFFTGFHMLESSTPQIQDLFTSKVTNILKSNVSSIF